MSYLTSDHTVINIVTSICMATYNGEKYLAEQVNSILSQMGESDELIVVDDASTDGTLSYLERIVDPRVKVFSNQLNIGHVQTFARCLNLASGKYILMSDQDDVWIDGRLQVIKNALESGVLLVSSNSEFIDSKSDVIKSHLHFPPFLSEVDSGHHLKNIKKIFFGKAFYYGCCMGLSEELRKLILPIPAYVESHDIWIAMAANLVRSNAHLNRSTVVRRIHDTNATELNRNFFKKIKSRFIFILSILNLCLRIAMRRKKPKFTENPCLDQTIQSTYKICSRCIMDTSDPGISFNERGECDYCRNFESAIKPDWHKAFQSKDPLSQMADAIRKAGEGKEFDCIIGLSGGLDSSYAAFVAKEKMGLRPLLFHVDAGWNTDQAAGNIEKLVDGLGLDLFTEVVNWEAVKRMQVAFFRAGIPDQDLVQDAVFFSGLYRFARKHKIKHIMTGSNYSTECCREPEAWGGYLGIDKTLFGDIWAKCGDGKPNDEFPLVDILTYKFFYQKVLGLKVHHPLNLVAYIKKDVEDELERRFGWQPFKHKHQESRFTRFYEDFWLPRRFGYEKRRAHFSSLIMTDQMTRDQAIDRIYHPEMDEHFLKQEFEFVAHKLGLTVDQLQRFFDMPKTTFRNYKNKRDLIAIGAKMMRKFNLEKRYFR
jgi:N-acetyl sugar amidotransferase